MGRWVVVVMVVTVSMAACGGGDDEAVVRDDDPDTETVEWFDIPVDDVTTMDAYAPPDADAAPVAVVLHGTLSDRTRMAPFAAALADVGAVVFVPSWPVIEQLDYANRSTDGYLAQVEAVVCSLRAARRSAPAVGGDPGELTLIGFSGGGMVGATVSLVTDPPWDGIDCDDGTAHAPTRFVGIDGDYRGVYQWAQAMPAEFAPFAPMEIAMTNAPVIRLFAGLNDQNVNAYQAGEFFDRTLAAGADVRLMVTGAEHGEAVDPSTPIGRFVVDQVAAEIHGESDVFATTPATAIGLTFDGRRCDLTGPTALEAGDLVELTFRNDTDVQASFGMTSVYLDTDLDAVVGDRQPTPVYDPPSWIFHGGFRSVPPNRTSSSTWLVDDHYHWLPVCLVDDPTADDYSMVVRATVDDEVAVLTVR